MPLKINLPLCTSTMPINCSSLHHASYYFHITPCRRNVHAYCSFDALIIWYLLTVLDAFNPGLRSLCSVFALKLIVLEACLLDELGIRNLGLTRSCLPYLWDWLWWCSDMTMIATKLENKSVCLISYKT